MFTDNIWSYLLWSPRHREEELSMLWLWNELSSIPSCVICVHPPQICLETCQTRQNRRCQGSRAECSTLKPSSLVSVEACRGGQRSKAERSSLKTSSLVSAKACQGKSLSVNGWTFCLLTSLTPLYRASIHDIRNRCILSKRIMCFLPHPCRTCAAFWSFLGVPLTLRGTIFNRTKYCQKKWSNIYW